MIKVVMACEAPMAFLAVQMYVPPSFFCSFFIVKVCPSTALLPVGSLSKSFVQDITGGGYPMTPHSGRLISFPISAYIGPGTREMSGRAVIDEYYKIRL